MVGEKKMKGQPLFKPNLKSSLHREEAMNLKGHQGEGVSHKKPEGRPKGGSWFVTKKVASSRQTQGIAKSIALGSL